MSGPSNTSPPLLDPSATKAYRELTKALEDALLAEAAKSARGETITGDDLALAYQRLSYPSKDATKFADAQSVISQALRENRVIEWVSYGMAIILFVFGLVLIGVGIGMGDVATRVGCLISGSIVELLILVPFRFAINSRRHNMAMRMLGLIINRVDDPKRLSPLLRDTFLAVVIGQPDLKVKHD